MFLWGGGEIRFSAKSSQSLPVKLCFRVKNIGEWRREPGELPLKVMVTCIEVTAVDQREMGSRVDGDPFPGLMPRRECPSCHLSYGSWGDTLVNLMEPEKSLDASPHFIKAEIGFELGKTVTWVTADYESFETAGR